jgi:hypothetical protein
MSPHQSGQDLDKVLRQGPKQAFLMSACFQWMVLLPGIIVHVDTVDKKGPL